MNLRRHQAELLELCDDILDGSRRPQYIIASVTPGGGKSALPVILAHKLLPNFADRICWIVPRLSLQSQAEAAFMDQRLRELLGGGRRTIRQATNDHDPCRGHHGYTTTYQAVVTDPSLHAAEFGARRYILVLDEPHHVEADGVWHRALQPLIDQAALVLMMSGTLERGDMQRIAWLGYNGPDLDLDDDEEQVVIRYGRTDALAERAIVPLRFIHLDSRAEWSRGGFDHAVDSLAATEGNEATAALYTVLHTEFARQLLERAVDEWEDYRDLNGIGKLLVVAPKINLAKQYLKYLKDMGVNAEIATSADTEKAVEAIKRFRSGSQLEAIVTVGMAYEGLDVPAITHVACLTNFRSKPWLEQMIARAVRIKPGGLPWEQQAGYIYGPDDPMLREVFQQIEEEQMLGVIDDEDRGGGGGGGGASAPVQPLSSEVTDDRLVEFGRAIDTVDMEQLTPREREARLRTSINSLVSRAAGKANCEPRLINKRILDAFHVPRKDMTLQQLQTLENWLRVTYQLQEAIR